MDIGVLGAGAFGTAFAILLEAQGHHVTVWARTEEGAARMRAAGESSHLPGVKLPTSVDIESDLARVVTGRPLVLSMTPSQTAREVMTAAAPFLDADTIVVNAAKGIEDGTLCTIDEVYGAVLSAGHAARAAFLSGPTFAKELAAGLPAAIVVAARDPASQRRVQEALASERLRVYTSDDVVGVELGGALKNVIAIAAGISDGLGFGSNTRAALITRGLAEIARLGVKRGGHPLTFAGLAGMGDLVLTCTGDLSRNRSLGLELGRGRRLADIMAGMNNVAEGVKTARAARALAEREGVDMPIVAAVAGVLYEGHEPRAAVSALMRRELKAERA